MGVGFRDDEISKGKLMVAVDQGWMRSYVLYVDNIPCAFQIGFQYRKTYYVGGKGYDSLTGGYNGGGDGYPGFDIRHEVARGDVNRTMILFSEQEVITARLAGSGNKVIQGAGDHYFSSLELKIGDVVWPDWHEFSGAFDAFSVQMKGAVLDYSKHKPSLVEGDIILQSMDADEDIFQVHRLQAMDKGYIDDERYLIDKVAKAFAKDYDCKEVHRSYGQVDGRIYLEVTFENEASKRIFGRYVKVGNDVFALHCHSSDSQKANQFFKSLDVRTPQYTEQFDHTDSSLYFKSTIPWEKEDNYFERMFRMSDISEDRVETMDAYFQSSDLLPPGSNDKITLEYQRYGRYEYIADKQEYLEEERERINGQGDLIVESESYEWNDRGYIAAFVLSDSLSDYAYHVYKVLDGTRELSISYGHDGKLGVSKLYADFITHLNLLEDTLSRPNLFDDSPALLIEDLQCADTNRFEMANTYLQNTFDLSEEWEYAIGLALKECSSALATEEDRKFYTSLYNRARFSDQSNEMINMLVQEYWTNTDSAAYQKEILGLFAKMKDARAIDKIKDLLLDDAPIGITINSYDPFFNALHDSLELAARLYPEIMLLTEYEEYKAPVLETLAMLVDSNAINMSRLNKYRAYLERQAKIELKRFQSTGYEMDENETYYHQTGVDIGDYWSILWPWKDRKSVAQFYADAENSSKTEVKKAYALFQMDKGLKISDELIAELRPKEDPLADYGFLEKIDRLDLFPADFDIQAHFVKEKIKTQFSEYDYDWNDSKIDSIEIISTQLDSIRTRAFKTYFVKSRAEVDKDEKWIIYIVMIDENSLAPDFKYLHRSDEVSELKTEEEQFDLLLKSLIAENRTWPYYNQRRSMDLFSF